MSEQTRAQITSAQERFSIARQQFEELTSGVVDSDADCIVRMAIAAMDRAEEIRDLLAVWSDAVDALTERLDAVARESANVALQVEHHAKAIDAQSAINHELEGIVTMLAERVTALEARLSGTTSVAAHKAEPSIRVRISHAHTLKDGWRCDSTTVEYDGPLSGFDETVIADHLQMAAVLGAREANLRNAPQPRDAEVPW